MTGDGTRAVHAGLPPAEQGAPFLPGPVFASAFHLAGDPADVLGYARYGHPTWEALEAALGELEGGEAVAFASGMAACAAVLLPLLSPGDLLALPSDCYMTVRELARDHLEPRGVRLHWFDSASPELPEGATLLWLESPSNPGLDVCDIAALCERAHATGALVAVDNTLATPLGQRPLELGADISVSSDTKFMSGHADLLFGHVAAGAGVLGRVREWRRVAGAVPGPFEAWLVHRSLATLDLRLERQCSNALALAQALSGAPGVQAVRYPGLPGDPAHEVASRQMSRFGGVLTFTLADREAAERFLAACRLVIEATSFGGVHSSAERRGRWGGDHVPDGLIRMSAGCEDTEDLLADVHHALAAV